MSIDGYVEKVRRESNGDVVLTLQECAGQPRLTIVRATWVPKIGMLVWGGASSVIIKGEEGDREYRRDGYTRLIEEGHEYVYRSR